MSSNRGELYKKLFEAYKKAYADRSKQLVQQQCNSEWSSLKDKNKNDKEFDENVNLTIKELLKKVTAKKAGLLNFFVKAGSPRIPRAETENDDSCQSTSSSSIHRPEKNFQLEPVSSLMTTTVTSASFDENNSREKPSQVHSQQRISGLEAQITSLRSAIDSGLADETIASKLTKMQDELKKEKQCLKRKIADANRQKKQREKKKIKLQMIIEKNPELKRELSVRDTAGRPRVETDQPALLETISNIAIFGGAADDKRRSDLIRSCRTLDELHQELQKSGLSISRSGVYLRLLPRSSKTIEGKKHVKTLPVKLCRAQNDLHAKHPDAAFCTSTIRTLETIASILGPQEVCFISQDDKCRVPIGITAAKAQAPMIMHLEYKVRLPDHDWVVASRHKLIPSVYAGIVIEPNGRGKPDAVSYSGPTYITIRSGKHNSTSAETHAFDFEKLMTLESFQPIIKTDCGLTKPVIIFTVDGGPDENPRYPRVISNAIGHFKNYNLDAVYVATNAPGRSAYNRVERRMAPLSKELSGVILPYDHFGSHLDGQNKTVDDDLELKNFAHAGEILAQIWNAVVIDGYSVTAEYIPSGKSEVAQSFDDMKWYCRHVRGSQYLLQIVKCDSQECCGTRRSSLWTILENGFLPPPYPIIQSSTGLVVLENSGNLARDLSGQEFAPLLLRLAVNTKPCAEGFIQIPYDYFCPSIQSQLKERCCKHCGLYHASIKLAKLHARQVHAKNENTTPEACLKVRPLRVAAKRARELMVVMAETLDSEWVDESDVDTDGLDVPSVSADDSSIPIIDSLADWMRSSWEDE